jgi:hypothetical protein
MVRFGAASAAIAAVIVVAALTGCAPPAHGGHHHPHYTPTPGASASAVATPTPTPTATAASTLTIGPEGVGPFIIGTAIPTGGAGIVRVDPAGCNSDDTWGAWTAVNPIYKFEISTNGGHQYSPVFSFAVFDNSVPTITGLHAGDPAAAVATAYPHVDRTISGIDSTIYVINGTHGHLIIEVGKTDAHSVSLLNPGEAGKVISLRSELLADPVTSITNTDGYGNCHG